MHEDPDCCGMSSSVDSEPASDGSAPSHESNLKKKQYHRDYNRIRNRRLRLDPAFREKEHWSFIKRSYNLTKDQWIDLFEKQGRVCGCCGAPDPGSKLGWHTDHDHSSKKVRGIVCHHCNIVLGYIRDSAERAEILAIKLSSYLRLHG